MSSYFVNSLAACYSQGGALAGETTGSSPAEGLPRDYTHSSSESHQHHSQPQQHHQSQHAHHSHHHHAFGRAAGYNSSSASNATTNSSTGVHGSPPGYHPYSSSASSPNHHHHGNATGNSSSGGAGEFYELSGQPHRGNPRLTHSPPSSSTTNNNSSSTANHTGGGSGDSNSRDTLSPKREPASMNSLGGRAHSPTLGGPQNLSSRGGGGIVRPGDGEDSSSSTEGLGGKMGGGHVNSTGGGGDLEKGLTPKSEEGSTSPQPTTQATPQIYPWMRRMHIGHGKYI